MPKQTAASLPEDRIQISGDCSFKEEIEKLSGQSIASCYQCGECTGGCPVAYASDLTPNQVSRLVQLGQDSEVLNSSMIWLCVGCETCATRCPRGVELSRVMDALRETAIKRGIPAREPNIKICHEAILRSVAHSGRVFEPAMIGEYKLRTMNLFSDLDLGLKMFLKGKLPLIPSFIWGLRDMKKIFAKDKKNG